MSFVPYDSLNAHLLISTNSEKETAGVLITVPLIMTLVCMETMFTTIEKSYNIIVKIN